MRRCSSHSRRASVSTPRCESSRYRPSKLVRWERMSPSRACRASRSTCPEYLGRRASEGHVADGAGQAVDRRPPSTRGSAVRGRRSCRTLRRSCESISARGSVSRRLLAGQAKATAPIGPLTCGRRAMTPMSTKARNWSSEQAPGVSRGAATASLPLNPPDRLPRPSTAKPIGPAGRRQRDGRVFQVDRQVWQRERLARRRRQQLVDLAPADLVADHAAP